MHTFKARSLFLARRVADLAEDGTGRCGAGVCELRGSGHQHLL